MADETFKKAKLALREHLSENKEKVANDLEEMRKKSNQHKMEQTAIEWFYDQIDNKGKCIYEVIDQANEIFKQQIIEARITSPLLASIDKDDYIKEAEKYYNETFK